MLDNSLQDKADWNVSKIYKHNESTIENIVDIVIRIKSQLKNNKPCKLKCSPSHNSHKSTTI